MSETEIAWATGVFEGEGSIVLVPYCRGATRMQRHVAIKMTDRDVLERVQRAFGVGQLRGPFRRIEHAHYKPIWTWTVNRWSEIERVLRAMLPWLGERRRIKAQEMLACPAGPIGSPRKDRCKRGHDLNDSSNVRLWRGNRHCRACQRERRAA
jgi:hypothetical protein